MIRSILIISAVVLANFVTAEEITDISELTRRLDDGIPKILDKHKAPGVALAFVNGLNKTGIFGKLNLLFRRLYLALIV